MTTAVLPFTPQPGGFEWLEGEPEFDPARHLQLEMPERVRTLDEFGYTAEEIARTATPVAVTSAFRVLSDEGAAVLLTVARRLEVFARANPRIERSVRSGCHRSKWFRDLCTSSDVTEHFGAIYGIDIAPHPITSQLGHLNYAPSELGSAVDKWHHDTLALDYVMMVADPALLDGGDFEYFVGTKAEVAALAERGERPSADRCVSVEWPGLGCAVAIHGNMVVHRGGPLSVAAERITMVNGYISTDVTRDDQTRHQDLFHVDDPRTLSAEWTRYAAWRAQHRLGRLIEDLPLDLDPSDAADRLSSAVADVTHTVKGLTEGLSRIHHYEL